MKSITSRLEQEKEEGVADVNQISAAQTGATAPSFSLNQVKAGMTSVVNIALPSQMVKHKAKPEYLLSASTSKVREESKIALKDPVKMVDNESGAAEQEIDNAEDTKNVLDEMIIGKGIGNALKVMRDRGVLGKTQVKGRNLDPSTESQLKGHSKTGDGTQEGDRVKLKHFDKKGKELSMKEAFR